MSRIKCFGAENHSLVKAVSVTHFVQARCLFVVITSFQGSPKLQVAIVPSAKNFTGKPVFKEVVELVQDHSQRRQNLIPRFLWFQSRVSLPLPPKLCALALKVWSQEQQHVNNANCQASPQTSDSGGSHARQSREPLLSSRNPNDHRATQTIFPFYTSENELLIGNLLWQVQEVEDTGAESRPV